MPNSQPPLRLPFNLLAPNMHEPAFSRGWINLSHCIGVLRDSCQQKPSGCGRSEIARIRFAMLLKALRVPPFPERGKQISLIQGRQ